MNLLRDSVETSVRLKYFDSIKDSLWAHVYRSKLERIPLSSVASFENFNKERLQDSVSSVRYYRKQLQEGKEVSPIFVLVKKDGSRVLLDGAHRIVAHYIEKKRHIRAFILTKR
jgi:hypothetical protein